MATAPSIPPPKPNMVQRLLNKVLGKKPPINNVVAQGATHSGNPFSSIARSAPNGFENAMKETKAIKNPVLKFVIAGIATAIGVATAMFGVKVWSDEQDEKNAHKLAGMAPEAED